jgi:hypothetical protein
VEKRLPKTEMTISQLQEALHKNNIDEKTYLILPSRVIEGPLILLTSDDNRWRVVQNDRGEFVIDHVFDSEDQAARFFLKTMLLDPTTRKHFSQANVRSTYDEWQAEIDPLLVKYGLKQKQESR